MDERVDLKKYNKPVFSVFLHFDFKIEILNNIESICKKISQ